MEQISIFDFIDKSQYLSDSERVFETILERGSNIEGSIYRIKEYVNHPLNEFVVFLKHEFGIGGSFYTGYATWWDANGIKAGTDFNNMRLFSWDTVAKAFKNKYGGE